MRKDTTEEVRPRRFSGVRRCLLLTLGAWVCGLAWFALYTALRAWNEALFEPLFWLLVGPVWLLCLSALVFSIARLTRGWSSGLARIAVVVLGTILQCYAVYGPLLLIAFYVHVLAGGAL